MMYNGHEIHWMRNNTIKWMYSEFLWISESEVDSNAKRLVDGIAWNQSQEFVIEFHLENVVATSNLIENEIIESLLIHLIENCWLFLLCLCVWQVNKMAIEMQRKRMNAVEQRLAKEKRKKGGETALRERWQSF